jgi:hypothetical protein
MIKIEWCDRPELIARLVCWALLMALALATATVGMVSN